MPLKIPLPPGRKIVAVAILLTASLAAQEGVIIFTGSANGVYQNCLCPDKPLGGLERRAQFISDLRSQNSNALVLDGGDNFVEFLAEPVAEIMVKGLQLIGYDLINLGDQDIAYAPESYYGLDAMISAFGAPVVIHKGSLTYSILPMMHPRATRFYDEGLFETYGLAGWEISIEEWLDTPAVKGEVKLLLSHAGFERDKKIAKQFGDIDIIIGGHSQTVVEKLVKVNGVVIVQAGGNAGYVGEIRLKARRKSIRISSYDLHPITLSLPGHPEMLKMIDQLATGR